MIYNHDMTQPPYGQNPYNPPTTPPPAFPNASAPGYPPGFPPAYSPESAVPVAPVAPAYAPVGSPYSMPEPQKKSAVLGLIGLGIVVICAIIFFLCSKSMYDAMFDILGPNWDYSSGAIPDMSGLTDEQMSVVIGPVIGLMISGLIGLVGFILSIVATVQNKGRIFAIVGIILGVLAPFSFFIAGVISMAAHGVS